jgi:uncharacterized protein DUF4157
MRTFSQKPKTTQPTTPARSSTLSRAHLGQGQDPHSILNLQRTMGNQTPLRLLQGNAEESNPLLIGAALPRLGHDFARIPVSLPKAGAFQTKLAINQPGDEYEQEADRVAERVIRMPEPKLRRVCAAPQVSRKCASCEEEEKKELQAKRIDGGGLAVGEAPSIVHEVLRQPGRPLDSGMRTFMEQRFGHDFSDVRIQDDFGAGQASLALRARAFTVGSRVLFAPGEYRPQTESGRHLLAHELAHTVQQRSPGSSALLLQRTTYPNCTDKQVSDMVEPAKDQAVADLNGVITSLGERPLSDDTKAALFLAFRSDDERSADRVKKTFEKIKTGLESDSIRCDQPEDEPSFGKTLTPEAFQCVGKRLGYTTPLFNIHICMKHWPGVSRVLRLQNLIHEGAHAFDHQVGDAGYFDYRTCAETASTEKLTSQRLETPDSYSCFVHYLKYDTGIKARAESYKGKTLAVTQDPGGPIDLNSTNEKAPMFRISGVPPHSGFQFRWVIADPADKRYLMRADTGNPFQFGNHTATFIGIPTRTLLKQRGITTAKVICRAMIPAQTDMLFEVPVAFTGV